MSSEKASESLPIVASSVVYATAAPCSRQTRAACERNIRRGSNQYFPSVGNCKLYRSTCRRWCSCCHRCRQQCWLGVCTCQHLGCGSNVRNHRSSQIDRKREIERDRERERERDKTDRQTDGQTKSGILGVGTIAYVVGAWVVVASAGSTVAVVTRARA